MKRRTGSISCVELYENVQVEITDNFRVCLSNNTRAFRFRTNEKTGSKVLSIDFKDQPYILIPWYDEKYLFCRTDDILDKACSLGLPEPFLTWLAGRM